MSLGKSRRALIWLVILCLCAGCGDRQQCEVAGRLVVAVWACSPESCGSRGDESTVVQSSDGRISLVIRSFSQRCALSGSWRGTGFGGGEDEWGNTDVKWSHLQLAHRDGPRWVVVKDEATNLASRWDRTADGRMRLSAFAETSWPAGFEDMLRRPLLWTLVRIATVPGSAGSLYLGR